MQIHKDNNGVAVYAKTGDDIGHRYSIELGPKLKDELIELSFQKGGVAADGVNGITSEALLAVLIHRLEYLNGEFPCKENVDALAYLAGALRSMESRTANRIARGVEGKDVE